MNLEVRVALPEPASDDVSLDAIRNPTLEPLRPLPRLLVLAYLIIACVYLSWRPTTLNPAAPVFSWLLYGAELFGFATTLLHLFMTSKLTARLPMAAPADLSVDVLIPTYNEPVELVRRTLLAARNLQYPCTIWLLDDGNRAEMAVLASELDVRYLARTDNQHAKAGNLNNALKHCRGEFVAIFDADHAPRRDFLDRTLGYFLAPEVAFVQTPQDFFNIDSYQHRHAGNSRRVWTEQSLFFRVIQRGKDRWNAAFFCGSCAVLRRSALDQIGGFATATVTEDLETSVKFHEAGLRSVYLPEPLAFGMAPSNASDFLGQRVRWGQGAMQVVRREWGFLRSKLTLPQRLNYLASALTYFDGWQKAIFYFVPAWVLLTGTMPIASTAREFLPLFVPYFLLTFIVFEEVGRGYGRTATIEQYNMARFAAFAWSTLALVRRTLRFKVTSKKNVTAIRAETNSVSPQIVVAAVNLVAIVGGLMLYRTRQHLPLDGLIANIVWAGLNLALAVVVVQFTMLRTRFRRREYRFPLPIPALLTIGGTRQPMVVDDISPAGCRVYGRFPESMARGDAVTGELHVPGGTIPFVATVASLIPGRSGDDRFTKALGLVFDWQDTHGRAELETFLFGSDLQWHLHDLTETIRTPSQYVRQLLTGQLRDRDDAMQHWTSSTLAGKADQLLMLRSPIGDAKQRMLVSHVPVPLHHVLAIEEYTRLGMQSHRIRPTRITATLMTPTGPLYVAEVEPC
jgi:cellulose synthase (UDP-forming)